MERDESWGSGMDVVSRSLLQEVVGYKYPSGPLASDVIPSFNKGSHLSIFNCHLSLVTSKRYSNFRRNDIYPSLLK